MLASFSIEGKVLLETKQLKLDKRKSTNISEVYLITLLSMSVSWLTFNISNLAICFRISSYLLAKKQKKFLSLWYEYSEYVRMISVRTMLPTIASRLSYWTILLCCYIEIFIFYIGKNFLIFNQSYFFMRCYFVIQKWFYSFPKLFIVVNSFFHKTVVIERRNSFFVLYKIFLFARPSKLVPNSTNFHNIFGQCLFHERWIKTRVYFYLQRPWWFIVCWHISKKKKWKLSSLLMYWQLLTLRVNPL